jgi:hypothetical protein
MEPDVLRAWMDKRGHTPRTLAPLLGVDYSTIQRWLARKSRLPHMVELALEGLEGRGVDRREHD